MEGIGNSIAFRLTGSKSNRDAIGAVLRIEAGELRQTKFLSAGSGFASQHTKEIFFGLGNATATVSVTVHWPSGTVQRFDHLPVNHRVALQEGETAAPAMPYATRQLPTGQARQPLLAGPPAPNAVSTWLIEPLFGPDLVLPDLRGDSHQLSSLRGGPALVSFFSLECGESRRQIEALQASFTDLTRVHFSLLSVALNAVADRAAIEQFARSAGISLPVLVADERTATAWNIQYRYLFDRRRDIEAPTTFLIDIDGSILRIYQGLTAPASILKDWETRPKTADQRFARAMPFAGPYYGLAIRRDYFTFGVAFIEYGFTDQAQACFQRVLDVNPDYANAWFNLGTIYMNKKQYAEARKCLRETLRISPADADAWNNLGLVAGEEQKYDEALDFFLHAVRVNPNYELAVQNMLRIYQYQNRPADAQKVMEELIALAPGNSNLHLGLAMTLVAQNALPPAVEQLQKAISIQPYNTEALNNLGALYMRMGRDNDALVQFEQCRRLTPDFDRPTINLALLYQQTGHSDKALQLLQDFSTLHPENTDVKAALSRLGAR